MSSSPRNLRLSIIRITRTSTSTSTRTSTSLTFSFSFSSSLPSPFVKLTTSPINNSLSLSLSLNSLHPSLPSSLKFQPLCSSAHNFASGLLLICALQVLLAWSVALRA